MKNAKVIEIFSRQEITALPYNPKEAESLIACLMRYKDSLTESEILMLDHVLCMIENNSGVTREDVLIKLIKGA